MYRKETTAAVYKGAGWVFSPPRITALHLLFVFILKVLEIFVCTFLLLLFHLNFWKSFLEPNWLPPMDTMADEWDLIKEWAFGTRLLPPIIFRNNAYSTSSSPHNLKMSLTPFMKDLQRDLDEEGITTLNGRI